MAVTPERVIEAQLASRFGGTLPVRLEFVRHAVMAGYTARVSIPGQYREVFIPARKYYASLNDPLTLDDVTDEVHFAIYTLLELDEEA